MFVSHLAGFTVSRHQRIMFLLINKKSIINCFCFWKFVCSKRCFSRSFQSGSKFPFKSIEAKAKCLGRRKHTKRFNFFSNGKFKFVREIHFMTMLKNCLNRGKSGSVESKCNTNVVSVTPVNLYGAGTMEQMKVFLVFIHFFPLFYFP